MSSNDRMGIKVTKNSFLLGKGQIGDVEFEIEESKSC